MKKWQLAFIVPRYGQPILGGAETFVREMANHVVASGLAHVEVFTTCASDHLTWQNDLPAGTASESGVLIHRFPVRRSRDNAARHIRLSAQIAQHQVLAFEEQLDWASQNPHAPDLYAALARHADRFDFLFFAPYLAGTTLFGTAISSGNSILWPCLHDEPFAHLTLIRDMFHACRGIIFNAESEMLLAERLYGKNHKGAHLIGIGFDDAPIAQPERFRTKYELMGPFMLYSGRLEPAKNVELLIAYFRQYCADWNGDPPIKLVLMGAGSVPIPTHPHIIGVGYQPHNQKADAFAAASALCQPSINESFSIVLMESWQQSVPVLVNEYCDVTRQHVLNSNGGLLFASYEEFAATVDLLVDNDALRLTLGRNGKNYVKTQFSWDSTLERFENALCTWTQSEASLFAAS